MTLMALPDESEVKTESPNAHVFDLEFITSLEEIDKAVKRLAKVTGRKAARVRKMYLEWVNNKVAGPGRPKMELDPAQVQGLAAVGCTIPEIAAALNCSIDTIKRNYMEFVNPGRLQGKVSLRRQLWRKALEEGNVTMGIFLAKNELGMKDGYQLEHSSPDGTMTPKVDFKTLPEGLKQQLVEFLQSKI